MRHPLRLVALALVLTPALAVSLAAQGAPAQAPAQAPAAAGKLAVAEAKLGTGVADRMITGEAASFAPGKVYVWVKVTGGPGDIKVVWKMGTATDSVDLKVGGDPWRTWSYKTVTAGSWTVTVTDAAGATLKELTFEIK